MWGRFFSFVREQVRLGAVILCVPVLEALLLRTYLKSALHLSIGWSFMVDYDLLFPIPTALVIYLCVFDHEISPSFQRKSLQLNVLLLGGFIAASMFYSPLVQSMPGIFPAAWWTMLGATLVSGLFVFVPARQLFPKQALYALPACFLVGTALILQKNFMQAPWQFAVPSVMAGVCAVLQPVMAGHLTCSNFTNSVETYGQLNHPDFSLLIGNGCAGFEGLLLFITGISFLYLFFRRSLPTWYWIGCVIVGVAFTIALNIFRLAALFAGTVWVAGFVGPQMAEVWFETLWHTHLGWFIYLTGLGAYFGFSLFYLPKAIAQFMKNRGAPSNATVADLSPLAMALRGMRSLYEPNQSSASH